MEESIHTKCKGNKADDKVESHSLATTMKIQRDRAQIMIIIIIGAAATRLYESFTLFSHFDRLGHKER